MLPKSLLPEKKDKEQVVDMTEIEKANGTKKENEKEAAKADLKKLTLADLLKGHDLDKATLAVIALDPEIGQIPIVDGVGGPVTINVIEKKNWVRRPWWLWTIGLTDMCLPLILMFFAGSLETYGVQLGWSPANKDMATVTYIFVVFSYMVQFSVGGMMIIDLCTRDDKNLVYCLRGYMYCSCFLICYNAFILSCIFFSIGKSEKRTEANEYERAQCIFTHLIIMFMRLPMILLVHEFVTQIFRVNKGQNMCPHCETPAKTASKYKITIHQSITSEK